MTKTKTVSIFSARIKPDIHLAVKIFCAKNGLKIQAFLEDALLRELEAKRTGKK